GFDRPRHGYPQREYRRDARSQIQREHREVVSDTTCQPDAPARARFRRFEMRWSPIISLIALFPAVALAQEKKAGSMDPIKVVALDRKTAVAYEKEIEPVLVNKCLFCHSGPVKEGRLDMSTYESLMKGGKRGKAVVPGKSGESLMVKL